MKHRGWKEIADAVGCGVRKAQELAYHPEQGRLPLPVQRDAIGVVLDSSRLELWSAVESEPALKHLARTRAEDALRRELGDEGAAEAIATSVADERAA